MKSTNQLKMGSFLAYLNMFIGCIVSIIYTPIMLRMLGTSEYGLYQIVLSVVSYLNLLNFGFGSVYIKYYITYKSRDEYDFIAKLNGMFLIIFSVIGAIAFGIGVFLVYNIETILGNNLTMEEVKTAKMLMSIMLINATLSFPNIVFLNYIIANERFVFNKILIMIQNIITPCITIVILSLGYGSVGMVITSTAISILIQCANMYYCLRKIDMKFTFRKFDFKLMKEMTVFSSFIFIQIFMDQVLWNVDKFILGRYRGTTDVAIYSVAAQLNTYYMMVAGAISEVFVPKINTIVSTTDDKKSNEILTDLMIRIGRIQFLILSLILLGFIFFGHPFVLKWAGEEYGLSYTVTLILIVPITFSLIQNIGMTIQIAKNKQKFLAIVNFIIAISNICISIPLAKRYGGVGTAIGTSICAVLGFTIIANVYYHIGIGLNMKKYWKEIFKMIPLLIPSLVVGMLLQKKVGLYNITNFMVGGVVFVLVYVFVAWVWIMNEEEKKLFYKPAKKIYKRVTRKKK